MQYISTDGSTRSTLDRAFGACYAQGQALYMPETYPAVPRAYLNNIADMSLPEIAYVVTGLLLGDSVPLDVLKTVVDDSFNFDIPLRPLGNSGMQILELFGGPTMAFKDISIRFMARFMQAHASRRQGPALLLVATTGNTGAAVARAFADMPGLHVLVLYPRGAMDAAQLAQFDSLPSHIHTAEVSGTIADCKRMVREAITDASPIPGLLIASGNTHNVIRLIPQVAYFFHAYARLRERGAVADTFDISIPCGNLSNLTSAVMARHMGLPIGTIVAGCASNDTLPRVLDGSLDPAQVTALDVHTLARAMDSGFPTNLPRLLWLYRGSPAHMAADVRACSVSDDEIVAVIREVRDRYGYLMDPHTAVAYAAASRAGLPSGRPAVVLATAHPAKEPAVMRGIVGDVAELSQQPRRFNGNHSSRHTARMAPTLQALKRFIHNNIINN